VNESPNQNSNKLITVVLVEDDPNDATLIRRAFSVQRATWDSFT